MNEHVLIIGGLIACFFIGGVLIKKLSGSVFGLLALLVILDFLILTDIQTIKLTLIFILAVVAHGVQNIIQRLPNPQQPAEKPKDPFNP